MINKGNTEVLNCRVGLIMRYDHPSLRQPMLYFVSRFLVMWLYIIIIALFIYSVTNCIHMR